jgi:hypothetical protein
LLLFKVADLWLPLSIITMKAAGIWKLLLYIP